jgi:hypothetical protein
MIYDEEESKTPLENYIRRYGINRLACQKEDSMRLTTHMLSGQIWLKKISANATTTRTHSANTAASRRKQLTTSSAPAQLIQR